jgi:hypothetical protein
MLTLAPMLTLSYASRMEWLGTTAAACYLGVHRNTLWRYRANWTPDKPLLPWTLNASGRVVYRRADLDALIERRVRMRMARRMRKHENKARWARGERWLATQDQRTNRLD